MQPKARPKKYSAPPDLPRIQDRLPHLNKILRGISQELAVASSRQSYIPYWEEIYAEVHGIKGCIGLLECPDPLKEFILDLDALIREGLEGTSIYRDLRECAKCFGELEKYLSVEKFTPAWTKTVTDWKKRFIQSSSNDLPHLDRMKLVSSEISHINDGVSKRFREIDLLGLSSCLLTEEISLEEIPDWKNRLKACLNRDRKSRALAVNILPLLKDDVNSKIEIWCWIADQTSESVLMKRLNQELTTGKTSTLKWRI